MNREQKLLEEAKAEARKSLDQGGIPIGSVLVLNGEIIGRGHNRRVQQGSVIRHAEMDALENAGRLTPDQYRHSLLVTTLSPCPMCSGAALLYRIPRILIGENQSFMGDETHLRNHGVELSILQDPECIELMRTFIRHHPDLWNEDIGGAPIPG